MLLAGDVLLAGADDVAAPGELAGADAVAAPGELADVVPHPARTVSPATAMSPTPRMNLDMATPFTRSIYLFRAA